MNDRVTREALGEELARRLASAVRAIQLYAAEHPLVGRSLDALLETITELHAIEPTIAVGFINREFVLSDAPLPRAGALLADLIGRLQASGVERIAIERGVTANELRQLVRSFAQLGGADTRGGEAGARVPSLPHIRVGRLDAEQEDASEDQTAAALRRRYLNAVAVARAIWESAATEGKPDPSIARQIVDDLADAATANRHALAALTTVKSHDDYTFTHMVNVSILTMAQARALGTDARLLREFGLAGLMHDIGKVRTPAELLTKRDRLSESEFRILHLHTVDGAQILLRTPEMPVLAPVVAFEHHLRLDGSGYPYGVARHTLNLGTMICSIADVYDAMRSERAYQRAFPSDRVLAVLQNDDGLRFDRHLVRRFVQLLGTYPIGMTVRLSTGDIAVVTRPHALDPTLPEVRVVIDTAGGRLEHPRLLNLWALGSSDDPVTIQTPVEAEDVGIDPLQFIDA